MLPVNFRIRLAILIIPKILHAERLWNSRGSIEGIVTASFFPAVLVVLLMVTAVMADLVEKVALLMVEAVEKDMMPLQHMMMVFL